MSAANLDDSYPATATATEQDMGVEGSSGAAEERRVTTEQPVPPPPSLASELSRQCLTADKATAIFLIVVHVLTLLRFTLMSGERLLLLALVAAFVVTWVLATLAPQRYIAVRVPLVCALRLVQYAVLPVVADVLRVMDPEQPPAAAAPADSPCNGASSVATMVSTAASVARAVTVLLAIVGWLHGSVIAAIGMQLPPLEHLAVQGATVVLLCRRAPPVCHQFLSPYRSPWHPKVVEYSHEMLQLVMSVVCLGSCAPLAAVGEAINDTQKCVTVIWTLQVFVGFVLPTLMVWRAQVRATRQFVEEQREVGGCHAAEAELKRSPYMWLCRPVLETVDTVGWALFAGLVALWGFMLVVL